MYACHIRTVKDGGTFSWPLSAEVCHTTVLFCYACTLAWRHPAKQFLNRKREKVPFTFVASLYYLGFFFFICFHSKDQVQGGWWPTFQVLVIPCPLWLADLFSPLHNQPVLQPHFSACELLTSRWFIHFSSLRAISLWLALKGEGMQANKLVYR